MAVRSSRFSYGESIYCNIVYFLSCAIFVFYFYSYFFFYFYFILCRSWLRIHVLVSHSQRLFLVRRKPCFGNFGTVNSTFTAVDIFSVRKIVIFITVNFFSTLSSLDCGVWKRSGDVHLRPLNNLPIRSLRPVGLSLLHGRHHSSRSSLRHAASSTTQPTPYPENSGRKTVGVRYEG